MSRLDIATLQPLIEAIESIGIELALKEGWLDHSKSDHQLHSMLKKYNDLSSQIKEYCQKLREEYEF